MRRVVVTGMALASPLGCSREAAFERLQKYENCVVLDEKLNDFERMNCKLVAPVHGFVLPEHFNRKVLRTMGPVSIMSVATAEEALKDCCDWYRPKGTGIINVVEFYKDPKSNCLNKTKRQILQVF